jgi:hypothetical protein
MFVWAPDYQLVPTGEQYARAMTYVHEQSYRHDRDFGHSTDEYRLDVFLGDLAEQVAVAHLTEIGPDVRLVSDEENPAVDLEDDVNYLLDWGNDAGEAIERLWSERD